MVRVAIFGVAFLLAVTAKPVPAAAQSDDSAEPGEEAGVSPPQAAPADGEGDATGGTKPKGKARRSRGGRRAKHAARFEGRVVPESALRKDPLDPPSGDQEINTVNTNESVKVNIYNEDGSYNIEALRQLDHVLRCRRTDAEKPIEPRLFTLLSHVYDHFGGKPLELVSGFRNQRKQTSNHFKGTASDIRINGVTPKKIEAFAETLDTGGMGIGIYPRSQFVHIDVRPLPSFRWTDYSPPNPDAPEKRPPRGWKKRKKLES
jgi:uncharacterized protein YcbK (DUF882 family)